MNKNTYQVNNQLVKTKIDYGISANKRKNLFNEKKSLADYNRDYKKCHHSNKRIYPRKWNYGVPT
jgi:hypothetical protein